MLTVFFALGLTNYNFSTDVCGFLVSVYDSPMDDDHGYYSREVTILLEDNGVLACGYVYFSCVNLVLTLKIFYFDYFT